MAVSIARALARIKADVRAFVRDESIERAARDAGHRWRERQLGPVETVHLFVLQVIHFNTAMRHLRHLAGRAVNAAAYCAARMRLPLDVLRALLRDSAAAAARSPTSARWCGLRVLLVDGSSTIAPDTPGSRRAFGQPTGQTLGCGFPVPEILALFDALSGMVLEALCLPLFTHEQSSVWRLHPMLGQGDLLVGDRGFCSHVHPPGHAAPARRPRAVPRAPAADRRLPPAPHGAPQGPAGPPALTRPAPPRPARPARRPGQAQARGRSG